MAFPLRQNNPCPWKQRYFITQSPILRSPFLPVQSPQGLCHCRRQRTFKSAQQCQISAISDGELARHRRVNPSDERLFGLPYRAIFSEDDVHWRTRRREDDAIRDAYA